MSSARRAWTIVALLVGMTGLQVSLAAFSLYVLSGVRAYVAGESLYSKGQKDAQIYLADYAEHLAEDDYRHLMQALSVPIADRHAREALQQAEPDVDAARRAFIAGGNHPDDVDVLIRLFRWFGRTPLMADAIATWTEGDRAIEQMRRLVESTHQRVASGDSSDVALRSIRAQAPELNRRLTDLESRFSAQLGEASRRTQRILLVLNGLVALVLAASGTVFVRRAAANQARAEEEVERRREELRRGQIEMERLVSEVSDGVISYDEAHRVLVFNSAAEKMFETTVADALGKPLADFFGDDEPWPALVATGAGELITLKGKRKRSGEVFHLEASFSRLQTERGPLHTLVLRDITQRELALAERKAHEALEASNRAKTQFLSRMSHELRTPLNAVIGFAQLMRADVHGTHSPKQVERIEHIERAGAHLLALVNDVLDLSRIESGEMSVTTEAVDLVIAMQEAATLVSPLVTQAGIELVMTGLEAPAGPPAARTPYTPARHDRSAVWVRADPVRLRQVLVNLLSNAIKYNRPGGSVTLTLRSSGRHGAVCIADTGVGMSRDKLVQLFEPFNRLGAETSGIEGTGIGLALSRRLCELMGAQLDIASVLGAGTTATVSLELVSPAAARARRREPAGDLPAGAGALDVLYAEDNEVNAELVRQIVSKRPGVTLRVADNGTDALALVHERVPDLMLIDMNLGDMTGVELARALRRDRETRSVELVALSADALPEQIRAARAEGFGVYLTKPIDVRQLLAVLDERLPIPSR